MSNRANSYPNKVMCPLVERMIDDIDCIENQDCVNGLLKSIPEEYTQKAHWKNICEQCPYFEID